MTATQYFAQLPTLRRRIEAKQDQIARLRSRMTGPVSRMSHAPGGGAGDWTDVQAQIAKLEDDIRREIDRLTALRRDILAAIDALPDPALRELLEYRYVNGWTWQKVALAMHYGRSTAWRLHKEALANFPHGFPEERNGV